MPSFLTKFLRDGAFVLVTSIPVPAMVPIIPLFFEFGSMSNSGALWHPAQPKPPPVLYPLTLNVGGVKKRFLPWFSCCVKLEKGAP